MLQHYNLRSLSASLVFLAALFLTHFSFAQIPTEQDCLGAIPICGPVWSTSSSTLGVGNYPDEDNPSTCLVPGEYNSTWFVFTVVQSGDLAFEITPNDLYADYDWSLYNLTNATCQDIPNDDALQVSCNSSQWGYTGISSTGVGNYNGPGFTNAFNYLLPVNAGELYVLNVNNWSVSNGGYTIDFSTATAAIYDTVKPQLFTLDPIECNATSITFNFSENILCTTIEDADFSLTGPGGPFTLSGESGYSCENGGTQEKTFTIDISPPLENGGTYYFSLDGSSGYVTDLCGNVADSNGITFVAPGPVATIDSIHQPICTANGGGIFIGSNSGISPLSYSLNGGLQQPTGDFTGLSEGTYIITVTDSAGCFDTVQVNLFQGPGGVDASIVSSANLKCPDVCDGTIVATGTGGTTPYIYSWTNSSTTTSTASDLCAGTYVVTIEDALGCFDTAIVTLTKPDDLITPVTSLVEPTCNGYADGSISVSVSGGTPGYTYNWFPAGGNGTSAFNLTGGSYTLTITDANQCVYDTVIVLPQPDPVVIETPPQTVICIGSSGELLASATGGTPPYTYEWDGSSTANPLVITPNTNTSYTVIATDSHGCTSLPMEFPVTVDQIPVVDLGNDSTFCAGDSIVLDAAFPGAQYLWQDGSNNDTCIVIQPGTYSVEVFNSCFSTGDTMIANSYDCSSCVHYPTAFSPDGNQNTIFHALITCSVTSYVFRIYNRWGELIFDTNDQNAGWNGTYKGKPSDVGVYVWHVDYSGMRAGVGFSEQLSGNITLVR